MTTHDRQSRPETERQLINHAIKRLLTGSPQQSDGKLIVFVLAVEAQVPRQRLYEHHADLIADFRAEAGGGPLLPSITALQQQLADARALVQEVEAREAQLLAQNHTLCTVITELTHEAHTDNVTKLHTGRSRA